MRLGKSICAALVAASCVLPALPARAADRVPAGADPNSERWYFTLAYCAGRLKELEKFAQTLNRSDAGGFESGMNMLFTLSVDRLMEDRGIPQDKAVAAALDVVKMGVEAQQSSDLVYTAAGKMNEEIDRRLAECDTSLKAYAKEFPQKFGPAAAK